MYEGVFFINQFCVAGTVLNYHPQQHRTDTERVVLSETFSLPAEAPRQCRKVNITIQILMSQTCTLSSLVALNSKS